MMKKYAPNEAIEQKAQGIIEEFQTTFGPMNMTERALALMVRSTAWLENLRYQKNGVIMRQPPTLRTEYPKRYTAVESGQETVAEEPAA
jgi:hypothetical protein